MVDYGWDLFVVSIKIVTFAASVCLLARCVCGCGMVVCVSGLAVVLSRCVGAMALLDWVGRGFVVCRWGVDMNVNIYW